MADTDTIHEEETRSLVPTRHTLPPDAPPIRVNPVDPEEAAAQASIDNDVLESWGEWKGAGKPSLFNSSPRSLYVVDPDRVEPTIKMLNNAARLYPGVRIKVIKPVPIDAEGKAWLYWIAKERQTRAASNASRRAEPVPPVREQVPELTGVQRPRFVAPRG
jgi:hypothetical protein